YYKFSEAYHINFVTHDSRPGDEFGIRLSKPQLVCALTEQSSQILEAIKVSLDTMVGETHPPLVCYVRLDYLARVKYGMSPRRDDHCVAFWLLYQLVAGGRRKSIRDLKNSACVATPRRSTAPISFTPSIRNCDFDFYLDAFKHKSGESGRFTFSEE